VKVGAAWIATKPTTLLQCFTTRFGTGWEWVSVMCFAPGAPAVDWVGPWLTGLLAPNFWLIRLGLLPLLCGLCLQFFCAFLKIFGHLHELKSARIIQREAIG